MSESASQSAHRPRKRLWIAFLPIFIFTGLALIFAKGLMNDDPGRIPSVLLGKPVPEFDLPALEGLTGDNAAVGGLSTKDLNAGKVTLVNVWASWCGPCRQEHPLLMKLAKDRAVRLVGINYKDKAENARRFLGSLGNPFSRIGVDSKGITAVDWGVYGVPETFIVDGAGIIRYKWIGPMTESALNKELLPRIRSTQAKSNR